VLHACQPGFEPFLVKELDASGAARGPGWVRAPCAAPAALCFAHWTLEDETALRGGSARQLAQALTDFFLSSSRDERYEGPWPLVVEGAGGEGLSKRARGVQELFTELAGKRMSRVLKLAAPGRPGPGAARGLFALLTGPGELSAGRTAVFGGQRRMADDAQAPSRSYLKAEEAYAVLGLAPAEGELVADLGAAPGGWSFSAAKRGARVIAVDNGPLKGGALGHPLIEHRREDAFAFDGRADWLFCDMIEDPERVLRMTARWLEERRCRRFVVNLKYGRLDPLPLLRRARQLAPRCERFALKHLYHDRDEVTMVGALRDAS
jgi:23S rRNA (cytidine2498-2'-O)-methyltransferase